MGDDESLKDAVDMLFPGLNGRRVELLMNEEAADTQGFKAQ